MMNAGDELELVTAQAFAPDTADEAPRATAVSVVVPTYRRPDLLHRCLAALFAQTMAASEYEIIIVDDGPSKETYDVVASWSRKVGGPRLRYLTSGGRRGPAAARNVGWRAARGTIIAFTDDDCIPDREWLDVGAGVFQDPSIDGVSGRIVMPIPLVPTDYEQNAAGLENAPFATANCLYRATILATVGGFDERFTQAWREDTDLEFALRTRGCRLVRETRAVVVHPVRPAPWGVSIRLQRNNFFNALLYKKHPVLYRQVIRTDPPWFYYWTVGAGVLTIVAVLAGWPWLAWCSLFMWIALTAEFCRRRLFGTSRKPTHVLEMIVTSLVIPPVAIFWRLKGALAYQVVFF